MRSRLVVFENRRGNNWAMTRPLAILRNKDDNLEVETRLVLLTAGGMPVLQNTTTNQMRSQFLEGPEKFSHPKSRSKISNLMTSELFYAVMHTFFRTRSFRRINLFVFKCRLTKNGFVGARGVMYLSYIWVRYPKQYPR